MKDNGFDFTFDYEIINSVKLLNAGNSFSATGFIKDNLLNTSSIQEENIHFEDDIKPLDKWDYLAAFSSGTMCSIIDILFTNTFSLKNAKDWGNKEISNFIIDFAKHEGFNKDDLKDAIAFLERRYTLESDKATNDFGGGLNHHLRDFVHHPSLLGLVFSILSQLTEKGFGTDKNGCFIITKLDHSLFANKTLEQRIYDGTVTWMFHLISDMAGSSTALNGGTGIPGFVLSTLKELSALPFFNSSKINYKGQTISYSQMIAKIFNGTYFKDENNNPIRFDLRAEIGIINELSEQLIPVLINECIIRSFYAISRLCYEIKDKNIQNFDELKKINPANFLPFNSDSLNKMLLVSKATFTAIDTSQAAVAAYINKDDIVKDFLVRINIPGIVSLTISCCIEIKTLIKKKKFNDFTDNNVIPALKDLTLDRDKSRILYSLEYLKTSFDITKEKNLIKKAEKLVWLNNWESLIIKTLQEYSNFFIKDIQDLKIAINSELNKSNKKEWFYTVSLELSLFTPYFALEKNDINKYKKLKFRINNINKVIAKYQNFMTINEIRDLNKLYNKYNDLLTNKKQSKLIKTGITATATMVVGITTFFYAPQLSVILVGKNFAGLYGAALTKASLAMIGGGSLAMGGLGIAGGTAILAGGGSLLSLITTGVLTSTISNILSDSNTTLNECTKLMCYAKFVLIDRLKDYESVEILSKQIKQLSKTIATNIEDAKQNKNNPYYKNIKSFKKSINYLDRCWKELTIMYLDN